MMKKALGLVVLCTLLLASCKKRKIQKNIEGTWTVSGFFIDGINEVQQSTTMSLEFYNVEKGEGDLKFYTVVTGTSYQSVGTFKLNDDYSRMTATVSDGSYDMNWDVALTIDESSMTLNGTLTDNVGSPSAQLVIDASK